MSEWYTNTFRRDWNSLEFFRAFECDRATPETLDALWADGWRLFGKRFFRDMYSPVDSRLKAVVPLRVNVGSFCISRSQRRTLKNNADVSVVVSEARHDPDAERLLHRHNVRFAAAHPTGLHDILSPLPALEPCVANECRVTLKGRLVAISYFHVGHNACSSAYAVFDPQYARRSLGIYTLLQEIEWTRQANKKYLYLGYTHADRSRYDYKKQFSATEFYNWQGLWQPLEKLPLQCSPKHPIEDIDITKYTDSSIQSAGTTLDKRNNQ